MHRVVSAIVLISFILSSKGILASIPTSDITISNAISYSNRIKCRLDTVTLLINKDVKQAIVLAKEVLKEAETINNSQLVAESSLTIGKGYNYLGANAEALEYLSKALDIFRDLSEDIQIAYTLREIGNIYYRQRDYASALNYYKDVLTCGNALNDTSLLILALIGKGSVYGNTNRLDSAMIIFEDTFQLSKKVNDKSTEVHSLFNIGDVYRFTDRPDKALEVFKTLEKEYDVAVDNSRILSSLYLSMANVYLSLGKAQQAREYSNKLREALNRFPRNEHRASYHHLSFQIDTLEKNFISAIQNHINFKRLSDSLNTSRVRENLANFQILNELNAKEQEITRLTLDNELKNLALRQKNIINYGSAVIILLLVVFVFQVYRSAKKSKEKNVTLQMQQEELAAANEELHAINEELHNHREELDATINKLITTQNQLVQSEKMASLGVMATGIAHEINNPLNFIHGGVVALERYFKEKLSDHQKEVASLFEIMHTGVNRATKIVRSLDHYNQKSDTMKQSENLHTIIDNCLLILNNQFKNRIRIEKDFCDTPFSIVCNEGKVHQAILSVITNALQAIEDCGTISIKTSVDDNNIVISITDTGCGISDENISKITDPFFSTKEPGFGTGLGLTVAENIVKEHDGSLKFRSQIGKGTTVFVYLPLKH
ncbi:MAG: tetratricopeptide repeat protein [Tenuifilaceae bacterium]|jgi:signal transduction histidine kinase|nr:tetratricopeptide repeat protein [Tenuifilaceae bacterium]